MSDLSGSKELISSYLSTDRDSASNLSFESSKSEILSESQKSSVLHNLNKSFKTSLNNLKQLTSDNKYNVKEMITALKSSEIENDKLQRDLIYHQKLLELSSNSKDQFDYLASTLAQIKSSLALSTPRESSKSLLSDDINIHTFTKTKSSISSPSISSQSSKIKKGKKNEKQQINYIKANKLISSKTQNKNKSKNKVNSEASDTFNDNSADSIKRTKSNNIFPSRVINKIESEPQKFYIQREDGSFVPIVNNQYINRESNEKKNLNSELDAFYDEQEENLFYKNTGIYGEQRDKKLNEQIDDVVDCQLKNFNDQNNQGSTTEENLPQSFTRNTQQQVNNSKSCQLISKSRKISEDKNLLQHNRIFSEKNQMNPFEDNYEIRRNDQCVEIPHNAFIDRTPVSRNQQSEFINNEIIPNDYINNETHSSNGELYINDISLQNYDQISNNSIPSENKNRNLQKNSSLRNENNLVNQPNNERLNSKVVQTKENTINLLKRDQMNSFIDPLNNYTEKDWFSCRENISFQNSNASNGIPRSEGRDGTAAAEYESYQMDRTWPKDVPYTEKEFNDVMIHNTQSPVDQKNINLMNNGRPNRNTLPENGIKICQYNNGTAIRENFTSNNEKPSQIEQNNRNGRIQGHNFGNNINRNASIKSTDDKLVNNKERRARNLIPIEQDCSINLHNNNRNANRTPFENNDRYEANVDQVRNKARMTENRNINSLNDNQGQKEITVFYDNKAETNEKNHQIEIGKDQPINRITFVDNTFRNANSVPQDRQRSEFSNQGIYNESSSNDKHSKMESSRDPIKCENDLYEDNFGDDNYLIPNENIYIEENGIYQSNKEQSRFNNAFQNASNSNRIKENSIIFEYNASGIINLVSNDQKENTIANNKRVNSSKSPLQRTYINTSEGNNKTPSYIENVSFNEISINNRYLSVQDETNIEIIGTNSTQAINNYRDTDENDRIKNKYIPKERICTFSNTISLDYNTRSEPRNKKISENEESLISTDIARENKITSEGEFRNAANSERIGIEELSVNNCFQNELSNIQINQNKGRSCQNTIEISADIKPHNEEETILDGDNKENKDKKKSNNGINENGQSERIPINTQRMNSEEIKTVNQYIMDNDSNKSILIKEIMQSMMNFLKEKKGEFLDKETCDVVEQNFEKIPISNEDIVEIIKNQNEIVDIHKPKINQEKYSSGGAESSFENEEKIKENNSGRGIQNHGSKPKNPEGVGKEKIEVVYIETQENIENRRNNLIYDDIKIKKSKEMDYRDRKEHSIVSAESSYSDFEVGTNEVKLFHKSNSSYLSLEPKTSRENLQVIKAQKRAKNISNTPESEGRSKKRSKSMRKQKAGVNEILEDNEISRKVKKRHKIANKSSYPVSDEDISYNRKEICEKRGERKQRIRNEVSFSTSDEEGVFNRNSRNDEEIVSLDGDIVYKSKSCNRSWRPTKSEISSSDESIINKESRHKMKNSKQNKREIVSLDGDIVYQENESFSEKEIENPKRKQNNEKENISFSEEEVRSKYNEEEKSLNKLKEIIRGNQNIDPNIRVGRIRGIYEDSQKFRISNLDNSYSDSEKDKKRMKIKRISNSMYPEISINSNYQSRIKPRKHKSEVQVYHISSDSNSILSDSSKISVDKSIEEALDRIKERRKRKQNLIKMIRNEISNSTTDFSKYERKSKPNYDTVVSEPISIHSSGLDHQLNELPIENNSVPSKLNRQSDTTFCSIPPYGNHKIEKSDINSNQPVNVNYYITNPSGIVNIPPYNKSNNSSTDNLSDVSLTQYIKSIIDVLKPDLVPQKNEEENFKNLNSEKIENKIDITLGTIKNELTEKFDRIETIIGDISNRLDITPPLKETPPWSQSDSEILNTGEKEMNRRRISRKLKINTINKEVPKNNLNSTTENDFFSTIKSNDDSSKSNKQMREEKLNINIPLNQQLVEMVETFNIQQPQQYENQNEYNSTINSQLPFENEIYNNENNENQYQEYQPEYNYMPDENYERMLYEQAISREEVLLSEKIRKEKEEAEMYLRIELEKLYIQRRAELISQLENNANNDLRILEQSIQRDYEREYERIRTEVQYRSEEDWNFVKNRLIKTNTERLEYMKLKLKSEKSSEIEKLKKELENELQSEIENSINTETNQNKEIIEKYTNDFNSKKENLLERLHQLNSKLKLELVPNKDIQTVKDLGKYYNELRDRFEKLIMKIATIKEEILIN